jgi:hypothetical protein
MYSPFLAVDLLVVAPEAHHVAGLVILRLLLHGARPALGNQNLPGVLAAGQLPLGLEPFAHAGIDGAPILVVGGNHDGALALGLAQLEDVIHDGANELARVALDLADHAGLVHEGKGPGIVGQRHLGQPLAGLQAVAPGDDIDGLLQVRRLLPVDFGHVGRLDSVFLRQLEGLAGLDALELESVAQIDHLGAGLLGHVVELGLLPLRQERGFIDDPDLGLAHEVRGVLLRKLDVLL